MKGRAQTVPWGLLWSLFCSVSHGCERGFVGRGAQGAALGAQGVESLSFWSCLGFAILYP